MAFTCTFDNQINEVTFKIAVMVKRLFVKLSICIAICVAGISELNAQIATNYEVGTWYGFKTAAVSYTFDDNCSNQLPVAMPLFDKYGYKMTFFSVINWAGSLWSNLLTASQNGHEIASHTVTHLDLSTASVSAQDAELSSSQTTINSKITNTKCVTLAYPNCNIGDKTTIAKYYIAGRICSGQIVSSSPSDFYNISSIICGASGSVKLSADFNSKVQSALSSKGWCVFLIHGVDGDGGYSSLSSSELSTHLAYMNTNYANYWIGTFGNVVKYVKERTAAKLVETTISSDSLQAVITDGLDNTIYDAALSFRRVFPSAWAGAKVYLGTTLLTSTVTTVNNVKYVNFNVAPDKGNVYIVNTASSTVAAPTVTSPVTYCQNATATALTATGTALKWYTVLTGGTALSSAPIPSTAIVGSTTYYVSQTIGGNESPRSNIVVTITASPALPTVTSPVNYLQGATATALTATATSPKWYSVSTGGTALATVPVPLTTATGTTNYYVSQTTNNCESARAIIVVNVSAAPVQTISLVTGWNYIGCPISGSTSIASALSSIWANVETVKNQDAFYSSANSANLNSLTKVEWGQGYLIKVSAPCVLDWTVK